MNSSVRFVSVCVFQAHTDTHFPHDYAKKVFVSSSLLKQQLEAVAAVVKYKSEAAGELSRDQLLSNYVRH